MQRPERIGELLIERQRPEAALALRLLDDHPGVDQDTGTADRDRSRGEIVAGVAHFNKTSGTDASSLITGSGAFKDVARSIFAFAADKDGQVITETKNSLGHSNLPSLAYRILEATVPTGKGDARVGRLVLDGESERTVQDILSDLADSQEQDEKARAEDYLWKALAGGPRASKEVEEEAREVHGISKRTLDRARRELKIPAAQRPGGW